MRIVLNLIQKPEDGRVDVPMPAGSSFVESRYVTAGAQTILVVTLDVPDQAAADEARAQERAWDEASRIAWQAHRGG